MPRSMAMLVLVTGVCVMWRQAVPHWEHRQLGDIEYVRTEEPFKASAQKAFLALATSVMEERLFRWLTGVDFGVIVPIVPVVCCWSVVFDVVVLNVRQGRILVFSEIHGWSSIWFIDGRFLENKKIYYTFCIRLIKNKQSVIHRIETSIHNDIG